MHRRGALLLLTVLVSGCAHLTGERNETVLPVSRAWVDGRQVEYVTTDISDATMAKALGVNYVPRLRKALGAPQSVLERVYKFSAEEQISIFQSAPRPVGALNADTNYSPLWRLVLVSWLTPRNGRVLKSEEELLAAEEAGQVRLELTDIVVNCPVTKAVGGEGLAGVR
ncbi:MAG: hypothetical protein EBR49_01030 [Betaproteobacteria bacterium]|nr:hypothetical protein [Betaproteobacteria bacterium]